jgi:zinc transporter ZupT
MTLDIIWLMTAVILGGVFVTFLNEHRKPFIKLMLAFSGGFLLSMAFNHFVPELYATGEKHIGLFILAGFLIQLLLEFFSGGIEHGHIHVHKGEGVPLAMLISLSVHSFLEGIPLGANDLFVSPHHHGNDNQSLLLGIIFHQFPVAIALMTLLLKSNLSKSKAWFYLLLFGIMTPAGMLFGATQNTSGFDFSIIMAIVVGMFLHISTTIIFETSENHKFNLIKLSAIVMGGAIAILIH